MQKGIKKLCSLSVTIVIILIFVTSCNDPASQLIRNHTKLLEKYEVLDSCSFETYKDLMINYSDFLISSDSISHSKDYSGEHSIDFSEISERYLKLTLKLDADGRHSGGGGAD